jgi:hypothetical protein
MLIDLTDEERTALIGLLAGLTEHDLRTQLAFGSCDSSSRSSGSTRRSMRRRRNEQQRLEGYSARHANCGGVHVRGHCLGCGYFSGIARPYGRSSTKGGAAIPFQVGRLRSASSARACSIIRANSALGRLAYFVRRSENAFSSERHSLKNTFTSEIPITSFPRQFVELIYRFFLIR